MGRAELGTEHYRKALGSFEQAVAHGSRDSQQQLAQAAAAQRNFARAEAALKAMPPGATAAYLQRAVLFVDAGNLAAARSNAAAALKLADGTSPQSLASLFTLAAVDHLSGNAAAAKQGVRAIADRLPATYALVSRAESAEVIGVALSAALLAQRLPDRGLANRILAETIQQPLSASPELAELATVIRANDERLAGHPEEALSQLKPLLTGHELFQTRQALFETYLALSRPQEALDQSHWLRAKRGLAYAELVGYQSQQILNVADSNLAALRTAELLRRTGMEQEARREATSFDRLWPRATLPAYWRERRAALDASSAGGI
jgi:hypothetical protein